MNLNDEKKMFNNLENRLENLKSKYLQKDIEQPLWKCTIPLELTKEELENWNTISDDNLWKISIKK